MNFFRAGPYILDGSLYESCDTTIYGHGKSQGISRRLLLSSVFLTCCIAAMHGMMGLIHDLWAFLRSNCFASPPDFNRVEGKWLESIFHLYHLLLFQGHCLKACLHLELPNTIKVFPHDFTQCTHCLVLLWTTQTSRLISRNATHSFPKLDGSRRVISCDDTF
jgi:hypothetical protein